MSLSSPRRAAIAFATAALSFGGVQAVAAPLEGYTPLSEDACYALRDQIEASFQLSPAFLVAPRAEVDLGAFGATEACSAAFDGTAVLFETQTRRGFEAADAAMRQALDDAGWEENDVTRSIAADGVFATMYARAKGDAVCVVEVSLSLPQEAMAPPPRDMAALMAVPIWKRRYRLALSCLEKP